MKYSVQRLDESCIHVVKDFNEFVLIDDCHSTISNRSEDVSRSYETFIANHSYL